MSKQRISIEQAILDLAACEGYTILEASVEYFEMHDLDFDDIGEVYKFSKAFKALLEAEAIPKCLLKPDEKIETVELDLL